MFYLNHAFVAFKQHDAFIKFWKLPHAKYALIHDVLTFTFSSIYLFEKYCCTIFHIMYIMNHNTIFSKNHTVNLFLKHIF